MLLPTLVLEKLVPRRVPNNLASVASTKRTKGSSMSGLRVEKCGEIPRDPNQLERIFALAIETATKDKLAFPEPKQANAPV